MQLFGVKYRELFDDQKTEPVDIEKKAEQIKDDLIAKANALANGD